MKLHFRYHIIFGSKIKRLNKDCKFVKICFLIMLKGISERNMSSPAIFPSVFLLIIVAAMVILSTSIEGVTIEDHSVYASPSSTSTLPGFNFAAAGDWACTSDTTDTVNNIVDKNPELVLGLGDLS
jgi:hypothetical protein